MRNFKLFAVVVVGLVGMLLLFNGCAGTQEAQAQKSDTEGKRLLDGGRYSEALEEYRKIVYAYPQTKFAENARLAVKKCEVEIATQKIFQKVDSLANDPEKKEFATAAYFLEDLLTNYPDSSRALEAKQKIEKYKKEQEVKEKFLLAERYFDEGNFWKANGYFQKITEENTDSVFYKDAELMTLKCKEKTDEYEKLSSAQKRKLEEEQRRKDEELRRKDEEERRKAKESEEARIKKEAEEKAKAKAEAKAAAIKNLNVRVK